MKIEDLTVCHFTQTVYIIEPNTKGADMYKGYVANIPERLMNKEIRGMYAAYNGKEQIPILVVDV